MIDLPNEIKIKYDADVALFNNQIEDLKRKSIVAKKRLLSEQFEPYPNNGSKDDMTNFVLQFTDFILDLTLFPDDEVLNKLKELKFASHSLRWFVKSEDILKEIERLNNLKGLFFLPNPYLVAITSHLQVNFFITLIEDFGLNTIYNNADTNIVYEDNAKRYARRKYNEEKMQTPKMDFFEKIMHSFYNIIERAIDNNKVLAKKMVLQPLKGNTSIYYTILDSFHCEGISKNKVYNQLFPLLQMILKEEDFLSEEEFGSTNMDSKYDGDYSKYKIARVKKLLQKK